MSDNTAANLLLSRIGGPAAVTAYACSLGDTMTRLDHPQPLNNRQQGEQDTTTPWSMLANMQKILLVTAYYMTDIHDIAARKAVLADVGRIVAAIRPDGSIGKDKS